MILKIKHTRKVYQKRTENPKKDPITQDLKENPVPPDSQEIAIAEGPKEDPVI